MAELITGAAEVWTKLLRTDAEWVLVGTAKSIGFVMGQCACGHPVENHGDRAVAACVPDGSGPEEWDYWSDMMLPPRCYCAGWRAVK